MKSCSKSTAEKQGKICWLVARWSGGGEGGRDSGEATSFGWFVGSLRWFLLVAGDIGWFQVIC